MKIKRETFENVVAQARKDVPFESCGYLLGNYDTVTENYPMTNIDHSSEHFSFDPKEQFAAVKYARKNGLKVLANWHSHPASPSRPSLEDIRLANDPGILYAIISLQDETPVFNAFEIKNGNVRKDEIVII
ncbi:MAG: M67 family metallopeptidase [Prevotella sp.]|nr:M67 family metallopeptidase [Prevotella sp.]